MPGERREVRARLTCGTFADEEVRLVGLPGDIGQQAQHLLMTGVAEVAR